MNLQDLFNLAARKGKASTVFVPQQEQPSYFETVAKQPQRASTIFIPQKQMPSYLETAAQQPQQASTVFIPQKQMPSYIETANNTQTVSPLFTFPQAVSKPSQKSKPQKKASGLPPVAAVPAGIVQPAAIVSGLTPAGTVDYSQGDEYKAQMAQYRNLIAKEKQKEAEDLGMKIWMEKYGKSGLGLTGRNPLMDEIANAPSGFGTFVPGQGPTPAVLQAAEGPMKAFGQDVETFFPGAGPEGYNPLEAQEAQQQATADQADMATTVRLPIRNRVQAFLQGGM